MNSTAVADIREVSDGNDIKNAPNEVSRFAFKLEAKLPPGPAVRTITSNHILCSHSFATALIFLPLLDQIVCIVICQIAPEHSITDSLTICLSRRLSRGSLCVREMSQ